MRVVNFERYEILRKDHLLKKCFKAAVSLDFNSQSQTVMLLFGFFFLKNGTRDYFGCFLFFVLFDEKNVKIRS